MKIQQTSSVFFSLLNLIIISFLYQVQARKNSQICSSSCGNIPNISYPFRLKSDPPGCGDPGYELSCLNNRTVMEYYSGKYYVKRISYKNQIIRLVDVNLANGNCSLPYGSLSDDQVNADFRYQGFAFHSYTSFFKCSTEISDPCYPQVSCLTKNASFYYYVNFYWSSCNTTISELPRSCVLVSTVLGDYTSDVKNNSYEAVMKVVESGFDLSWSVECRDCLLSDGFCSYDSGHYVCFRSDGVLYTLFSALYFTLVSSRLVQILIGRFILAPIVLIVFLIHKYRTDQKTEGAVEELQRK